MLYVVPDLQLSRERHDDHGVDGCIWFADLFSWLPMVSDVIELFLV
jgi:hypothetical protein